MLHNLSKTGLYSVIHILKPKQNVETIANVNNTLLSKQLEKFIGNNPVPGYMEDFITAVERTYFQYERELEHVSNLEKINRELDQFAYIVSHDLKAPLRAMSSLISWIEEDSGEFMTKDSQENLQIIVGRIQRMENLIQGILAYSKAGKEKTEKTVVNVKELLNEIIDSVSVPPHITITNKVEVSHLLTEKIKLSQVFANLISNAIKYNDKSKGEIEIGCYEYDNWCQFYVQDNGPGIEKEYHEKVFMIFQTLNSRDEIESTGIGLSIVKKIVEEQNGKIWVESETGKGSRFVFTWPAIKQQ